MNSKKLTDYTILRKILHFLNQLWENNKDFVNITGSRSLRGSITT